MLRDVRCRRRVRWPRTRSLASGDAAYSGIAAAQLGGSILVLFQGRSEARGRILDLYDGRHARYEYSVQLPAEVQEIAASGSVLFLISSQGAYASVVAVRPRIEGQ